MVFGVSSSPFLLNATIRHHLDKYARSCPDLVGRIARSIYVNNIVCGAKDEEDAFELYLG